jgi:hypothetical protein
MFDDSKTVTLEGTVKSWEWKNPRMADDRCGGPEDAQGREWGLEGYAIGTLRNMGYARDSLKAGKRSL